MIRRRPPCERGSSSCREDDDGGRDAGAPLVVHFHGEPTTRLDLVGFDGDLAATGALVLSADRPGYGGSPPKPGRTMTDHVHDVVALLDHLDVDRFAALGVSLPRCTRAA